MSAATAGLILYPGLAVLVAAYATSRRRSAGWRLRGCAALGLAWPIVLLIGAATALLRTVDAVMDEFPRVGVVYRSPARRGSARDDGGGDDRRYS